MGETRGERLHEAPFENFLSKSLTATAVFSLRTYGLLYKSLQIIDWGVEFRRVKIRSH